MILGILLFVFVVVCLLMIVVILLQSSKGEGLASSAFGGLGTQSLFGGREAATFLSKLTTYLAIAFILLSLLLAKFYGEEAELDIERPATEATQMTPQEEAAEGVSEGAALQETEESPTAETESTSPEQENTSTDEPSEGGDFGSEAPSLP